jgi:hypothetical protein
MQLFTEFQIQIYVNGSPVAGTAAGFNGYNFAGAVLLSLNAGDVITLLNISTASLLFLGGLLSTLGISGNITCLSVSIIIQRVA